MQNKDKVIFKIEELQPIIKKLRQAGKTIVLTQGSFDMVHIGHGRYCQEAKKHGDFLIVGVDSDEKVRLRKGPDRPVVPQEERMEMLTYLNSVDLVVLKDVKAQKYHLIDAVKPDVLVATQETYTDEHIKELEKNHCKKVVVLEPMATTSTSAKIRRLQLGMAKKIEATLRAKLIKSMEEVLLDLKGEES